jgi:LysM repeat protein
VIWLKSGENTSPDKPVVLNTPRSTDQAPAVQPDVSTNPPPIFPTAASDEIAVALLTPAPDQKITGAIQRQSEPFTIRPVSTRSDVIQYTVQQGDTLEGIAAKFGLENYYTIIWSNSRNKYSPLHPGAQLNILPEDGVYYEVKDPISIAQLAEEYSVDPYAVIDSEYNDLFGSTPDTLLPPGMRVVVPGGKGEEVNLLPANTNSASGSGAVNGPYTLWGCTSNISGGSLPVNRPLKTSYIFMRGLIPGVHDGVDLAGSVGDPVYAAGAGTVAYAGWSDYGYGNVVVIAHGSVFSIYGHLSRYNVRCGQTVDAGQQIGAMGNTGNSSGPHLHFELRSADWGLLNPQDYVGF